MNGLLGTILHRFFKSSGLNADFSIYLNSDYSRYWKITPPGQDSYYEVLDRPLSGNNTWFKTDENGESSAVPGTLYFNSSGAPVEIKQEK